MQSFLSKHCNKIRGVLECFDRVIIKGHLPISRPDQMEDFIAHHGLLIKDFQRFVKKHSQDLVDGIKRYAEEVGRPYIYCNHAMRNEAEAKAIAERDGISSGLIVVFSKVERCSSFLMVPGKGRPRLVRASRKCLCLYLYFIDSEFGFMHLRIQSWFPFTLQVYVNGHFWLAKQLDKKDIPYQMEDNCLLFYGDGDHVQELSNRFARLTWVQRLDRLACIANPLLKDLIYSMSYYWCLEQVEFSTDIYFSMSSDLSAWYEKALKYAICCFGAEDVMTFLGRKLHHAFAGQIVSDVCRRWQGRRIKHRVKENWIKMYDKAGVILRVETVINRPGEFRVRRKGIRKGRTTIGWLPLPKGIAYMFRYAEVAQAANQRYLDAIAVVEDPTESYSHLHQLARPVKKKGRTYRGFNPADDRDLTVIRAVMRGEFLIHGFRNRDIRQILLTDTQHRKKCHPNSSQMTRIFKRMHVRQIISKIPRSRRWKITKRGLAIFGLTLTLYDSLPIHSPTTKAA